MREIAFPGSDPHFISETKNQNIPGVPFLLSYLPINPGRLILQNYRLESSALAVSKQVSTGAVDFQPEAQPSEPVKPLPTRQSVPRQTELQAGRQEHP